jgi:hypothetical protein
MLRTSDEFFTIGSEQSSTVPQLRREMYPLAKLRVQWKPNFSEKLSQLRDPLAKLKPDPEPPEDR